MSIYLVPKFVIIWLNYFRRQSRPFYRESV